MTREMTTTQIDRLGNRLKNESISDDDLRFLDLYRRSFSGAYEFVIGIIRTELTLEPTGRPAKSTTSISDKLHRESIRLSQIQDIAGCRLIVPDIAAQESVAQSLKNLFEEASIIDRRERPSHGYRAVHVLVTYMKKTIEIQVRTSLQHLWAELSEKFSDIVSPAIKYGGGDEQVQTLLGRFSILVANYERLEVNLANAAERLTFQDTLAEDKKLELRLELQKVQQDFSMLRQGVYEYLRSHYQDVEQLKGGSHDISN